MLITVNAFDFGRKLHETTTFYGDPHGVSHQSIVKGLVCRLVQAFLQRGDGVDGVLGVLTGLKAG